VSLRIAYMTGHYLRVSPFVFIHREIEALRRLGVHVETFSIRNVPESELVSEEQRREQAATFFVLSSSPWVYVRSHVTCFARRPGDYFRAKWMAWRHCTPGVNGFLRMIAYFLEAGVVAERMRARGLTHLHNHLADSSCTVALLASQLGGFSFSFSIHGPGIFYEPALWKIGDKAAHALFTRTISHFCRSQLMAFTSPQHWDRLHIVHCGIEPGAFTPTRQHGTGRNLLFVGRLAAVKGLPVLIEALARVRQHHPDVRLRIVGDGPDRAMLEALARDKKVSGNIEFLGYQNQDQLADLLRDTHLFVLASFAEGVPVVLMEAMAAGVPVIATRIAGIPELVEDGVTGYLTPPGDAATLAARITQLLGDTALRRQFAEAGRRTVEAEFNIDKEAAWLLAIMQNALEGRSLGLRPGTGMKSDCAALNATPAKA
jgi:colanic acid/amylovoran biosynthesis glycosyltransferase